MTVLLSTMRGCTHCDAVLGSDPTEHHELTAQYPEKVNAMKKRLEELKETAFTPVSGAPNDSILAP